jgi:uncharacterized protein (DUF885 family)
MSEVEAFADDLLYEMMALAPELAGELGVAEVGGRALPNDSLPDFSDEAAARRRRLMDDRRKALDALRGDARDADASDTFEVVDYLLAHGFFGPFAGHDGAGFPETPYPANHLSGWHPTMVALLARDHVVATPEQADAYLARLEAIPSAVPRLRETMEARDCEGMRTPTSSALKALGEIQSFAAAPPEMNTLVTSFREKLALAPSLDVDTLSTRATRIVAERVLPAYAQLLDAMTEEVANASGDAGYGSLPNGEAWYAWMLSAHATLPLTPQAVHQAGLEETREVQARIREEFRRLGFEGETISDLYGAISTEDRRPFGGSTDRSRALADSFTLVRALEDRARPLFARLPRAPVDIELVATEAEDNQHSRYTPPAAGRPGRLSLNLKSIVERPDWELAVLCAHEATPGHHTQLALAQELPLCAFRRTVVFTAYIEGWAKYAETLLDYTLMDDPYVRLGRLRGELYSSVNLALDTGIHWAGWSRERACQFFQIETGAPRAFAESVVDRSLVWPGQLCAYKIGMMKMLEIRDRFGAQQSPERMRAFHSAVLERGSLPLGVLERLSASTSTVQPWEGSHERPL